MKNMADEQPVEIGYLLYSALQDAPNQEASRESLSRIWSLELQWFAPEESASIITHLIDKGWLVNDSDMLSATPSLVLLRPPLGWRPILNSVLSVQDFELGSDSSEPEPESYLAVKTLRPRVSNPEGSNLPPDKAEGSIPHLIEAISSGSGLRTKEVLRRAQRKRRALGPVTLWMALALVAREQGLDMNKIVSAIGPESS